MYLLQDQTTDAAKAFLEVAAEVDSVVFGLTSEDSLYKSSNVDKDSVVIFKQFDEKRAELSDKITVDSIKELINAHRLPLVVYFSDDVSIYVYYVSTV